MTIKSWLLGTALVLAVAAPPVLAQTPPAPQPSPSPPAPQPSPSPQPFTSPFWGPGGRTRTLPPDSQEAKDFNALLDLYDAMLDAQAALKSAENCKHGIDEAKKALAEATARFNEALDEYIIGWDPQNRMNLALYRKDFHDHTQAHWRYYGKGVLDALAKADKKLHVVKACPAPEPPPPQTPPPPEEEVPYVGELGGPVDEWMMGPAIQIDGEYASLNPSDDHSSNMVGFAAAGFVPLGAGWRFDAKGGYDNISGSGPSADFWHLSGAVSTDRLLHFSGNGDVLTGINFGVQQISAGAFTNTTTDVGGFVTFFPSPNWNVNADVGGNWSSFNRDGFHLGGNATFYPCPRWAIDGGVHYTDFGTFNETDIHGGVRYLTPWHGATIGLSETYSSFSPGSSYMNTVWLSISVPITGPSDSLAQRDHSDPAIPQFAPVGLR